MSALHWWHVVLLVCVLAYCTLGVKVWRWTLFGQKPAGADWAWLLLVIPFWPAVAGYIAGFRSGLKAKIWKRNIWRQR